MKNIIIFFMIFIQYGYANDTYYYKNNKKINLIPINSISRDTSNIDYYKNNKDIVLGVTDRLILKFKDTRYLDNVLDKFNLILQKKLSENLYLLKTSNKNLTIDISNKLSEKEYIEYSQPDFIKKRVTR